MERTDLLENLAVLRYLSHSGQDATTGERSIYRAIGVEPIINCRGTFTIIGGSVQRPEAIAAAEEAVRHFVQYDELAEAVGRRLAAITGAPWGMVSSGCAAGLKHVTAACVTGGNPEKLIRIPDLTGMDKTQVIAPRYSRNAYDHADTSHTVIHAHFGTVTLCDAQPNFRAVNPSGWGAASQCESRTWYAIPASWYPTAG